MVLKVNILTFNEFFIFKMYFEIEAISKHNNNNNNIDYILFNIIQKNYFIFIHFFPFCL